MQRGAVSGQDMELYLRIASTPVLGAVCKLLPFIRDRVMGNPRFLLVLGIEEVIGVTAKTAAEIQGRGEDFWNVSLFSSDICALISSNLSFKKVQSRSKLDTSTAVTYCSHDLLTY